MPQSQLLYGRCEIGIGDIDTVLPSVLLKKSVLMACNQADDDLNGHVTDGINAESPKASHWFKSSHALKRCQCSYVESLPFIL